MSSDHDLTGITLDGRYSLTRLMGEGGMGQVYEGVQIHLDRKVAVKVLLRQFAFEPKFRERFLREAKAASKVRHPNVVQILDFGDTPNSSVYFVMELLEGRDLHAVLRTEGPLPWPRARSLLLQITSALGAAHDRRIIHRDIKPANCFVVGSGDREEIVKLLDFGIAKITADPDDESGSTAKSLTGTGEVFGTAKYMAPEQAIASANDPRVDVYSVGIMAYEMLTGQVPFTGPSAFHIITKHVNEPPRPPRQLDPEIPWEAEAIILRALAKRPEDRFGSIHEMGRALAAVGREPGLGALASNAKSGGGRTEPLGVAHAVVTLPHGQPHSARQPETLVVSRARGRATKLVVGSLGVIGALTALTVLIWSRDDIEPRAPDAALATLPLTKGEPPILAVPSPVSGSGGAHEDTDARKGDEDRAAITNGLALEAEATSEADRAEPPTPASDPAIQPPSERQPPSEPTLPKRPKIKKPPTDDTARARLSRSIEKRCRSLGEGVGVTVDILVGSDGGISNKLVRGAAGELERCVLDEVAKVSFSAGTMRKITVKASL